MEHVEERKRLWWAMACGLVMLIAVAGVALISRGDGMDPSENAPPSLPSSVHPYIGLDIIGSRLVRGLCISPDGRRLFVSSCKPLWVWDTQRAEWSHMGELQGCAALSPHGRLIAEVIDRPRGRNTIAQAVNIRDASSGKLVCSTAGHSVYADAACFSPDSSLLATGGSDGLRIWDAKSGKQLHEIPVAGALVRDIAFSRDGHSIAAACPAVPGGGGDHRSDVRVWEVRSGALLRTFTDWHLGMSALAYDRNGRWIACTGTGDVGRFNDRVIIWDLKTGQRARTLAAVDSVQHIRQSPDGRSLAVAETSGKLEVWDTGTWTRRWYRQGHAGHVDAICYSPDSKTLWSGGYDQWPKGETRVWSDPQMAEIAAWDTNGKLLQKVIVPDCDFGVSSMRLSSDSTDLKVSYADGLDRVWDLGSGRMIGSASVTSRRESGISSASRDGRMLAKVSSSGEVLLTERTSGKAICAPRRGDWPVTSLALSPDGTTVATAESDPKLRAASVGAIKLSSARTGKIIWRADCHEIGATCVAFSDDGRSVASGGRDGKIVVHDAATGSETRRFRAHPVGVSSVVFTPDGRRLITGGLDGTVRVWDASTGKLLAIMRVLPRGRDTRASNDWITYTPDSFYIATPGAERYMAWVVGDRPYPLSAYKDHFNKPLAIGKAVSGR